MGATDPVVELGDGVLKPGASAGCATNDASDVTAPYILVPVVDNGSEKVVPSKNKMLLTGGVNDDALGQKPVVP